MAILPLLWGGASAPRYKILFLAGKCEVQDFVAVQEPMGWVCLWPVGGTKMFNTLCRHQKTFERHFQVLAKRCFSKASKWFSETQEDRVLPSQASESPSFALDPPLGMQIGTSRHSTRAMHPSTPLAAIRELWTPNVSPRGLPAQNNFSTPSR